VAAAVLVAGCSAGSGTSSNAPHGAATTAVATTATTAVATTGSVAAGSTTAAGRRDPCSMLTADQVTAALGQPPAPGRPEPDFDAPECEWDPASGENGNVTVGVGPWVGDPGVQPLRLGTPVPGVGDEAYDGGNVGLYLRTGSQGLRIWVFNVHSQSTRLDLEKQLATILLAEMRPS
jgi:hypothetical protein